MEKGEQEVFVVDDGVHTPDQPYCDDPACWCHLDASYHEVVTHPVYQEAEIAQAYAFYQLLQ